MRDPLPTPWVREEAIRGDASSRRYARLWSAEGQSAIIVDYSGADHRLLERDLDVRSWCARHDLRVPSLYSNDTDAGWAILEDFGENDAEASLQRTPRQQRFELARTALLPLATLAAMRPGDLPPWNAPLDGRRLRWELAGFELWFLRYRHGRRPSAAIGQWFDDLAASIDKHPQKICHRDYHLNNLFVLDDGQVALIDFQDMLVGPDTYDAVSLLGERGMPQYLRPDERNDLRERWAELTGAAGGWRDRWPRVRIQRGLKALGTFARLGFSGTTKYETWLAGLVQELASDLVPADAPGELIDLLLDL